jgi:hypothetical protein
MTSKEILEYFGNSTVYVFNGTLQELKQIQEADNNSYNYLLVADIIYFTAANPVTNNKAVIFTGE